jgi:hypothetical protein
MKLVLFMAFDNVYIECRIRKLRATEPGPNMAKCFGFLQIRILNTVQN